jgi:dienelactone hydrolase
MKIFLLLLSTLTSCAQLRPKEIEYSTKNTKMKGYFVYNEKLEGKRPGILVVHEWWGHNEHAQNKADELAKEGYVALAVDMYGDGKTAEHPKDAGKFSKQVMTNFPEAKRRFKAALEQLKNHPLVDKEKIAAVGYCFGGGVVLNMARAGFDLDGVVSFHGSLAPVVKAKRGVTKASVLVLHGAADPLVPKTDISNIKDEMAAAGVDFKFIDYPYATHAFTNPKADEYAAKFKLPLSYDPQVDRESWLDMKRFLKRIFL